MISVPNDRPLLLDNPRVWRTYVGGANLETLHGRAPQNSQFPEEWIMSVVEAIMGLAISAGSMPILFASMGSMLPMVFASMITARIARQTVKATAADS